METLIEISILSFMFLIVVYLIYTCWSEVEDTSAVLKDAQKNTGINNLEELCVQISPTTFLGIQIIFAGVLFLLGTMFSVILGMILFPIGFIIPKVYINNLRKKRIQKIEAQLVDGLELLGNALKSGLNIQQATELLVKEFPPPISNEFSQVIGETRIGADFANALDNMAVRLDSRIVSILASSVRITKKCGGDLTTIFNNVAATIREQAVIQGKLNALTAQGRFQSLVLGAMPFMLLGVLWFVDRPHVETLFTFTIGNWALIIVVIMVTLAQVWIKQLMKIDV